MQKFARHLSAFPVTLVPCDSIPMACQQADIITTATANKTRANLLSGSDVPAGAFVNAIGGDCPGKTELCPDLLAQAHIVVEYLPQAQIEGEIQHSQASLAPIELHHIIKNNLPVRHTDDDIIVFDSVGIAIEDFSALRFLYELSETHDDNGLGSLFPQPSNPKDLFAELTD